MEGCEGWGGGGLYAYLLVRGIVQLHVPLPCAEMSLRGAEHEGGGDEQG